MFCRVQPRQRGRRRGQAPSWEDTRRSIPDGARIHVSRAPQGPDATQHAPRCTWISSSGGGGGGASGGNGAVQGTLQQRQRRGTHVWWLGHLGTKAHPPWWLWRLQQRAAAPAAPAAGLVDELATAACVWPQSRAPAAEQRLLRLCNHPFRQTLHGALDGPGRAAPMAGCLRAR